MWGRPRSLPAVALGSVGCFRAIAACGGSSPKPHVASSGQALKFANCMRAHGVSNYPDPTSGGGVSLPPGVDPSSPAFKSAQRACAGSAPNISAPPALSEATRRKLLKLSQCMRTHGQPNLPDPSTTSSATLVRARTSGIDPQSPAFKHAATACGAPGLWIEPRKGCEQQPRNGCE